MGVAFSRGVIHPSGFYWEGKKFDASSLMMQSVPQSSVASGFCNPDAQPCGI
jgi:hypothetical protein